MSSIFNSLHIGYTGLSAAQVGIDVTGHNISNAEADGYTRQKVVTAAATPILDINGSVGNGTSIQNVKRIFDNFVFDKYSAVSADKEFSDYQKQTLETLSSYFPEIDGVGIKTDLANYFDAWQTFADHPDNNAVKVDLATVTQTLTNHITQVRTQVSDLQMQTNNELALNINQVNDLAKELSQLNVAIDNAEVGGGYSANDLRDKRNVIEKTLSRLIGSNVSQGQTTANMQVDSNANTRTGSYTLSVNGFNIVDGNSYHELKLTNSNNPSGFYDVSYERQDGTLISMNSDIKGGKVGAIFNLRGRDIDSKSGTPSDGIIQNTITQLDAFAKGLVESTNNLYAQSATNKMSSNPTETDLSNETLVSSGLNIHNGAFDVIVYNIDGEEVGRRSININNSTVMKGVAGSNSIQGQLEANIDDNNDSNANNDIDNYVKFNYQTSVTGDNILELSMEPFSAGKGYTFAVADKLTSEDFASGTNFAGALGLQRYFQGDSAKTINLDSSLQNNPTLIKAGYSVAAGDNRTALDMGQQQFESYNFTLGIQNVNNTFYDMFDMVSTYVGTNTNAAISKNETIATQFNAVELEYTNVSKVNIDEEMTNLIKYQTSYGAAAKLITTIDQMMQTLLGIKQ